jgi:hypothetical protein
MRPVKPTASGRPVSEEVPKKQKETARKRKGTREETREERKTCKEAGKGQGAEQF